jgi:hypothetical protein
VQFDLESPVVALCIAGMQVDGTPEVARALFEQAWSACCDDYEASIAAHFLARHQETPAEALAWNLLAVRHAEAVPDAAAELMASLYLNLGDSYVATAQSELAMTAAERATAHLAALPLSGYRAFVEMGIRGLRERIERINVPLAS